MTLKNALGQVIAPDINRIPVRFHLYWAGSDPDGSVVGFYWAVTETLPVPEADGVPLPSLPGPKSSDYHFTTRTDSVFVFTTSDLQSERQHAFFIYAVDNKGKPDPTPARFIFRSYDRFPPQPIFDLAQATGTIYVPQPGGAVLPQQSVVSIRDTFTAGRQFPNDTIPSGSVMSFKWHALPTAPSTFVTGYEYKLDEPTFNIADSSVHTATYNTHVGTDFVGTGVKVFTLRAQDQSGWFGQATRYFQMNFAPDSWFAGPDTLDPIWTTYRDGNGKAYRYIDLTATGWPTQNNPTLSVPHSQLSTDSANVLPSQRPNRRTFFEVYGNQLWAHGEGDTVNLNSWLIFPGGGTDKDSPYAVHVAGADPSRPASGAVVVPGPPNGSPVGFRSQVVTRKEATGQLVSGSETTVYPVFDESSVFRLPIINAYAPVQVTGKAYAYVIAEDGDGTVDRRIQQAANSPADIVDLVDHDTRWESGSATVQMQQARPQIITFYVNHRPYLQLDAGFLPPPPQVWSSGGTVPNALFPGTYQRGTVQKFQIDANDIDPIDFSATIKAIGGPNISGPLLVRNVKIVGLLDGTTTPDTVIVAQNTEVANISFVLPANLAVGPADCIINVCDYRATDPENGIYGRCSDDMHIPIVITGPSPAEAPTGASEPTQRPGSPPNGGRSKKP